MKLLCQICNEFIYETSVVQSYYVCPKCKTMTAENFINWLQGYILGKDTIKTAEILIKLKTVTYDKVFLPVLTSDCPNPETKVWCSCSSNTDL